MTTPEAREQRRGRIYVEVNGHDDSGEKGKARDGKIELFSR
jgi:hypothetical protein